eukprot:COSAG03_NODE_1033_length_4987_cov_24.234247_5_plen_99_part_00
MVRTRVSAHLQWLEQLRTIYDRLTASERVDVGEAMWETMLRTRAHVVAGRLAIAGLTEGHWSGLMVLGCGTVSLGVASSSSPSSSSASSSIVPEGVPP